VNSIWFSSVNAATDLNSASYDALTLRAQKRMSSGLTFLGTWTWSKNYDGSFASGNFLNASGSAPQDYYNLGAEYAQSVVDTPHRVTASITYELPFGSGKMLLSRGKVANALIGGWQLNATSIYQTGFPLAITQSSNLNSVIGAGLQRPNATGIDPATYGDLGSRIDNYFNKAAFSAASQFTFGNLSRTISYRSPGQANWDASLFKEFRILEKVRAQFRAEALNVFNTPYFRAPNTSFGSSSFGKITQQANFPRYLQMGFRVYF